MEEQQVTPGSEEYNEQMASKFQTQTEAETDVGEELPVASMPEGGYEKFYNAKTGEYNWENHAKELEYRMQKGTEGSETKDQPESESNETQEENEVVNDIVSSAGLDASELQNQIETNGDISEEAYQALEAKGLSRDLVSSYVENLNTIRDMEYNNAIEYAGGEQEWTNLSTWAAENLSETEVQRYNELLTTKDWRVAIDALRARQSVTGGVEPRLVSGRNNVAGSTFGYRSKAEMKSDMSDPRYATDPAFRREVAQKMQSATWDLDAN
jgi:hypothetical protein